MFLSIETRFPRVQYVAQYMPVYVKYMLKKPLYMPQYLLPKHN
jgi:hypothetical protein